MASENETFDEVLRCMQNTNTTVFNTALKLMKQAVAEAAGESEVKK